MTIRLLPAALLALLLTACPSGSGGVGTLSVTPNAATVFIVQGDANNVTVNVDRAGISGPLTVSLTGLPAGVSAAAAGIPDGATSATVAVTAAASAAQGPLNATVTVTGGGQSATGVARLFVRGKAGSLDTTFNTAGIVLQQVGVSSSAILATAMQPDGRLVAVGYRNSASSVSDAFAARFLPDGKLDPGFGTGGVTPLAASVTGAADAVVVQANGAIVVAGQVDSSPVRPFVARLTGAGALDTYFNAAGAVPGRLDLPVDKASVSGLALTADGTIILVGSLANSSGSNAWAAAISSGGAPETNLTLPLKPTATVGSLNAVIFDTAHGDLIAAGVTGMPPSSTQDFAMTRFTPALGAPTPSPWGGLTYASVDFGNFDQANALTLDATGRLLVAGVSYLTTTSTSKFGVVRLLPNGTPDTTFNSTGSAQVGIAGDNATGVAALNAKIVVTGYGQVTTASDSDFYLVRLNDDGALDSTFGAGGRAYTDLNGAHSYDSAASLSVTPDGRLVLGGFSSDGSTTQAALARYWN